MMKLLFPYFFPLLISLSALVLNSNSQTPNTLKYSPAAEYSDLSGIGNNAANKLWGSAKRAYSRPYGQEMHWIMSYNVTDNSLSYQVTRQLHYRNSQKLLSDTTACPENGDKTALYYAIGQFLARDISVAKRKENAKYKAYYMNEYSSYKPDSSTDFKNVDIKLSDWAIGPLDYTDHSYTNLQTSYIDLSNVYGNSREESNLLRTFNGGELITFGNSLPKVYWKYGSFNNDWYGLRQRMFTYMCAENSKCEYDYVTPAMVTLFALEHNSRAKKLAAANPTWNDETLFQESRRWTIAIWQKIVFYDFLPLFIDVPNMPAYQGYDKNLLTDLDLMFSVVTLKMLKTEYPNYMKTINFSPKVGLVEKPVLNPFDDVAIMMKVGAEAIFRGLVSTPAGARDTLFSPLLNQVSKRSTTSVLIRDQAMVDHFRAQKCYLPNYDEFRAIYGIHTTTNYPWSAYTDIFNSGGAQDIEAFAKTWAPYLNSKSKLSVYLGMMIEKKLAGRQVGPLFEKSALDQFNKLQHGDRYYFENSLSPAPFSKEQIAEIKSTSIESLIFNNLPVGRFPRNGLSSVYDYIKRKWKSDDYVADFSCNKETPTNP